MSRFTSPVLIFLSAVLFALTVFGNHGLLHLFRLQKETGDLESHNRKLESEIAEIQNKVYAVQNSDTVLEHVSREEVGLSKPDDIVYIFPEAKPK